VQSKLRPRRGWRYYLCWREIGGLRQDGLIRHASGFMTAYAYNSALIVSEREKVIKGETIARSGHSGNAYTY